MLWQGRLGEVGMFKRLFCRDTFGGIVREETGEEIQSVRRGVAECLSQGGESARTVSDKGGTRRTNGGAALRLNAFALGSLPNPGQISSVGFPNSLKI